MTARYERVVWVVPSAIPGRRGAPLLSASDFDLWSPVEIVHTARG